jgi:DNA modification methylase
MWRLNTIHVANCLEAMKLLPTGFCDCCVTDPPYGWKFMGKKWDYEIPGVDVWKEVLRVLKPGAHMLVACGTRTQHRMAVSIEDGGFEIRDVICWHYAQGFSKSLDINKAIDKRGGVEREVSVVKNNAYDGAKRDPEIHWSPAELSKIVECGLHKTLHGLPETIPTKEGAKKWNGWGTALKPATEFWTLARKPLEENTITGNVLKFGVGGLNIDACRIPPGDGKGREYSVKRLNPGATLNNTEGNGWPADKGAALYWGVMKAGRFPANLILDEFMAGEMDKHSGLLTSGQPMGLRKAGNNVYGQYAPGQEVTGYGDSGGASRFFYVAKADAAERGPGNTHPTVKPLALMNYLLKLICPIEPRRIVLEPFAGSGTTCIAARLLGLDFVAFESNVDYARIAENRLSKELGLFYGG